MNGQLNNQMGLEGGLDLHRDVDNHGATNPHDERSGKPGALRTTISRQAKRLGPFLLRASCAMSPYTIPYTLYSQPQPKRNGAPSR
jgi:hypothetical protein